MHVALRHAHCHHPYHRPDGHDGMQHAQACRDGGERDAHGHCMYDYAVKYLESIRR